MRILLVEDDEMIGEAVADGLKGEGYAVDWVKDGNSAIIALDTTPFSLVILDLGLPGKDGLAVLKEIRFRKNHTPVLVTTARDTVNDRIEGLDAGADDYLIKPYDLDDLSARIAGGVVRSFAEGASPLILRRAKCSLTENPYSYPARNTRFYLPWPSVLESYCPELSWKKNSTPTILKSAPTQLRFIFIIFAKNSVKTVSRPSAA